MCNCLVNTHWLKLLICPCRVLVSWKFTFTNHTPFLFYSRWIYSMSILATLAKRNSPLYPLHIHSHRTNYKKQLVINADFPSWSEFIWNCKLHLWKSKSVVVLIPVTKIVQHYLKCRPVNVQVKTNLSFIEYYCNICIHNTYVLINFGKLKVCLNF